MSRRRRPYTQASQVTTRRADTGEVLGRTEPYTADTYADIIAKGNSKSDPSRRSRKRRNHHD